VKLRLKRGSRACNHVIIGRKADRAGDRKRSQIVVFPEVFVVWIGLKLVVAFGGAQDDHARRADAVGVDLAVDRAGADRPAHGFEKVV